MQLNLSHLGQTIRKAVIEANNTINNTTRGDTPEIHLGKHESELKIALSHSLEILPGDKSFVASFERRKKIIDLSFSRTWGKPTTAGVFLSETLSWDLWGAGGKRWGQRTRHRWSLIITIFWRQKPILGAFFLPKETSSRTRTATCHPRRTKRRRTDHKCECATAAAARQKMWVGKSLISLKFIIIWLEAIIKFPRLYRRKKKVYFSFHQFESSNVDQPTPSELRCHWRGSAVQLILFFPG